MKSRLWETLDLVRSGTMCKFVQDGPDDSHCALGFLRDAHGKENAHWTLSGGDADATPFVRDREALGNVLVELFPDRVDAAVAKVYGWAGAQVAYINNHKDTTQADLELALEKAAIRTDEVLS